MKFAKYLQNTETSEWKKAYIDYRGLKKLIKAVEISRKSHDVHPSDVITSFQPSSAIVEPRLSYSHTDEYPLKKSGARFQLPPLNFPLSSQLFDPDHKFSSSIIPVDSKADSKASLQRYSSSNTSSPELGHSLSSNSFSVQSDKAEYSIGPLAELPLCEILAQLTPQERAFFALLDAQVNKVECFYLAREKEMAARSLLLLNQLKELDVHRKMFLDNHTKKRPTSLLSFLSSRIRLPSKQGFKTASSPNAKDRYSVNSSRFSSSLANDDDVFYISFPARARANERRSEYSEWTTDNATTKQSRKKVRNWKAERPDLSISDDPSSYIQAREKLKTAVLEHYRGLELLHNYRVLNITGFIKALKKFQKVTKISVQRQYMVEKVGTCAFASDEVIRNMKREMEDMYAIAFVRGDKIKALKQLRPSPSFKSHHFSTFRSGLLLGFAIPALIDGLMKAFQPETQQAMPRWDVLLFIYGLIFVPVLYLFLVGINLLVWARSRVNYIFIFNLDVPTHLDYRQYFELPSLLLATLCFAFWLSFSRISVLALQFTTWPLVWLGFASLLLIHPMPILAKPSRYWLIKNVSKLFLSGIRPVEFADFWLGDQLCSFVFTLSNTSLFICVYLDNFSEDWKKCKNSSRTWPIAFALASIPFIIRIAQNIKQYSDCRRTAHLINAGKYATGIMTYLFYFMWSYDQQTHGKIFATWCIFNTCYSIYACSWDFLVDYGLLQPHSKHLFLRTDLMYSRQWLYYFAMLSNLLIRFLWIIYIPKAGPPMMVRSFITGMFEMLRRIQWNFCRLEIEHIRNMHRYRVTREMPLPYAFDFLIQQEDAVTLA